MPGAKVLDGVIAPGYLAEVVVRIQAGVPLMSIPAYSRARTLAVRLRQMMPKDDFESLCLYNAESNAILKAMKAAGDKLDLTKMKMYPCVVPDRGVSDQTMDGLCIKSQT